MSKNCPNCGGFLATDTGDDGSTVYECSQCERYYSRPPRAYQ